MITTFDKVSVPPLCAILSRHSFPIPFTNIPFIRGKNIAQVHLINKSSPDLIHSQSLRLLSQLQSLLKPLEIRHKVSPKVQMPLTTGDCRLSPGLPTLKTILLDSRFLAVFNNTRKNIEPQKIASLDKQCFPESHRRFTAFYFNFLQIALALPADLTQSSRSKNPAPEIATPPTLQPRAK
jgi:hypothetical protein